MATAFTNSEPNCRWQFWIDRGGTFTDVVGMAPDGSLHCTKLLSDNPRLYADATSTGIRRILGVADHAAIPAELIECVKIGTTVATNALLERKVEPTVLITNTGFADCLRIAYQNRPDIFARQIILPEQLHSLVVEINCRVDCDGVELASIDETETHSKLRTAYKQGFRSCAIALMHSYRFPEHELRLQKIASQIGFEQISVSHQVSSLVKLVSRGDTTVADACLSPVLKRYIQQVQSELPGVRLLFMQSNGGLASADQFRGKDSLLSGPAGGAVGAASVGKAAGRENIISFDMGGTSTDVAHIAGVYEHTNDAVISGVRIKSPMISINTVAAGGGSICHFDGHRMRVGPSSAGANPGPACYGNDGPLTITDCNLLLGRIQAEYFPKVFGLQGNASLDLNRVQQKMSLQCAEILRSTGSSMTPEAVAQGFLSIAVAKMAGAIKQISIERGHDLQDYALVSFGGAGGQHACQIADALGIKIVLIHPLAGVLSAYGIGTANVTCIKQETFNQLLADENMAALVGLIDRVAQECHKEINKQIVGEETITTKNMVALRYDGTDLSISVTCGSVQQMKADFEETHEMRFGFISPDKKLVIESISVYAEAQTSSPVSGRIGIPQNRAHARSCNVYIDGRFQSIPLWLSQELAAGTNIDGPALIADSMSTLVVEADWHASVNETGLITLTRTVELRETDNVVDDLEQPNPTRLELFNHIFMSLAEQMGTALQNTSQSINIKERLDFSCAIFDGEGNLVANAPHIPVHLGSMSSCVQQIIAKRKNDIQPGDVFVSNNPYAGGTHLPDITVVSPVFVESDKPCFYLASRGHHADVGGITPGSMPANSKTLHDEGILIDNFLLVRNGKFFENNIFELLRSSNHPARNAKQNVADLQAQIAANLRGEQGLTQLCKRYGAATLQRYMRFVQENSASIVKAALTLLQNGNFETELDSGEQIKVTFKIDRSKKEATIDFAGTSAQLESNMNAPRSITNAATMYVLRTLIDDDIPLNEGFLWPITIKIPEQCLLNPKFPAAVVAGNVETSQQITDALYGALSIMAASQGTMNNFTFGNDRVQYYETISGGSGAGPTFDGTSAVQTHMTNSRLTDPEILELRFPVILEEFSIRRYSGGSGEFCGGNGVIRKIKFREPVTASILSQRRSVPPFGLQGGSNGACGANYVLKKSGKKIELGGTATVELDAGDTFVIETPGGGGYGRARNAQAVR